MRELRFTLPPASKTFDPLQVSESASEVTRFLGGELDLINRLDPDSFERVAKSQPAARATWGCRSIPGFCGSTRSPPRRFPHGIKAGSRRRRFASPSACRSTAMKLRASFITATHNRRSARTSAANRLWFNAALEPLTSDGFTLRDGVLRDRDGHEVEFPVATGAGNRPREAMAAVIQEI